MTYAATMAVSSSSLGAQAGERELLNGFLDWYRAVVQNKVRDLSYEDATRTLTPTGLSSLGIVKHLAFVEQSWFKVRFAAEADKVPWAADDSDADFRIEPGDTIASIIDFYREAIADSRRVRFGAGSAPRVIRALDKATQDSRTIRFGAGSAPASLRK